MIPNIYAQKFGPVLGAEVDENGKVIGKGTFAFYPEHLPDHIWITFPGCNQREDKRPHWSNTYNEGKKRKDRKPRCLKLTKLSTTESPTPLMES